MTILKKLLAAGVVAATALTASAEFRWGQTAGVSFTDYHFKSHLFGVTPGVGGHGGLVAEWMFPGIGFGVDFGLNYSNHGAKLDLGSQKVWAADGYGNESVRLHTLQLPVHLRFKYTNLHGLERTLAPFAFAGPVFTFHLGDNGVKALEYPGGTVAIQFGLGVELFERLQISGNYDLGVSYEMRTRKLDNYSARPSTWNVNVTWLFGR